MPKSIALFICCLFVCIFAKAQNNVSGSVKDTTSGTLVKNAVVAMLSPKDSVLVAFTRTKTMAITIYRIFLRVSTF